MNKISKDNIKEGNNYLIDGNNQRYLINVRIDKLYDSDIIAELLEDSERIEGETLPHGTLVHFYLDNTTFYKPAKWALNIQ